MEKASATCAVRVVCRGVTPQASVRSPSNAAGHTPPRSNSKCSCDVDVVALAWPRHGCCQRQGVQWHRVTFCLLPAHLARPSRRVVVCRRLFQLENVAPAVTTQASSRPRRSRLSPLPSSTCCALRHHLSSGVTAELHSSRAARATRAATWLRRHERQNH
jgi:hypothetical protein